MASNRTYLGRERNFWGTNRVYLRPDSLEVDEISFSEIERTRVFFDDVLAVTYHRAINVGLSLVLGIFGGMEAAIGLILAVQGNVGAAIAMFLFAAPFLITLVIHLILKTDFITVFGRRTLARMKFPVRKERAREVWRELTAKIRVVQEAVAAAQPAPPAPPAPELPPGPPPMPANP